MNEIWLCSGKVLAVTIEKTSFLRTPFSWKESEKIFEGRKLFNSDGTIAEELTPRGHRINYEYKDGILLKTENFDSKGLPVSTRTYKSDEQGRPLTAVNGTDKHSSVSTTEWFYENEMTAEKHGNNLKVSYFDPESGKTLKELQYSGEKLTKRFDFQYNKTGKTERIMEYDGNENPVMTRHFTYDPNGRLSRLCEEKKPREKATFYYRYLSHYGNDWLTRLCYRIEKENERETEIPLNIVYRSLSYNSHEANDQNDLIKMGNIIFPDGKYSGETRKDLPHGKGVFTFKDGRQYTGLFDNGNFSGTGEMIWPDGKRYKGEFTNNLMEGRGELFWPNGDYYQGPFIEGQMHGLGIFTWNDGSRFSGLFQEGKRTDQGMVEPPVEQKEINQ